APDRQRHAVHGGGLTEQLGDAVERENRLAGAGLRLHARVRYLMTALPMSCVLTTSARFSSASTCRSLTPRRTAYSGLPASTPRRVMLSSPRCRRAVVIGQKASAITRTSGRRSLPFHRGFRSSVSPLT